MARDLEITVVVENGEAKRKLAEVDQAIGQVGTTAQTTAVQIQTASTEWDTYTVSAKEAADVLSNRVPTGLSAVRAGLNEVAEGAGLTFASLGLVGSAGLAIGVGYEAWQITRAVMEFFQLDEAVSKAWTSLLGFADAGAEAAAAKADVLAKASKAVGYAVTDMTLAMDINQRVVDDWNAALSRARAPEESRLQIEHWNQEIDKVVKAGVLKQFTADVESHNFSLKFLATNYGISTEAIAFFTKELKGDADAAKSWAKDQTDAAKAASDAHKAAIAVELAELKIMDEFRQVAHKRQTEIIRIQTDQQTKAAADVNAAIAAELAAQVTLNKAWGLDASGALNLQHDALTTLNRAMDALHLKKVEGISQTQQEQVLIDTYTKQLYDEARAHDAVTVAVKGATQSHWAEVDALFAEAQAAAAAIGMNIASVGQRPPSVFDKPSGGFSLGGPFSLTTPLPVAGSRAGGGAVSAGSPYWVGEQGPELFTPGQSGGITPNGGGPVIHVTVTGNNIDSEFRARRLTDQIAEKVLQKLSGSDRMTFTKR